ncbi:hypothetical protein K2Z84_06990, partial [Candidatus Binatia bacterium]|nr:hypothetical protein [Candidatus Binatia bacterium]
ATSPGARAVEAGPDPSDAAAAPRPDGTPSTLGAGATAEAASGSWPDDTAARIARLEARVALLEGLVTRGPASAGGADGDGI